MPLFEIDCSDIVGIIEDGLRAESSLKTISSIFLNERYLARVNYSPYFQRNYVWDATKATYFVESILLGTDIPPIVLFSDGRHFEVIDGRQRFETVLRFVNDEFVLKLEGLRKLTGLSNSRYSDLDVEMKNKFEDAKLRILEFEVANEPSMTIAQKDKIKKEIFSRYNSGIIPLKQAEIERAEYNDDALSSSLLRLLNEDQLFFDRLEGLFTTPRSRRGERRDRVNNLLSRVRTLLALPHIPIRSYAYGKNKPRIIRAFFEDAYKTAEEGEVLSELLLCVRVVESLVSELKLAGSPYADSLLVHQVFFWGFYLCMKNRIEPGSIDCRSLGELLFCADDDIDLWKGVPEDYRSLDRIFRQEGSHYDKAIVGRYTFCANLLSKVAVVDFSSNLKDPERFSRIMEERGGRLQFEKFRISKADPYTASVYDILTSVNKERFEIRPPYQRSETSDSKNASYLIESMMLDIRIPPIFVCKRTDGVSEVVDGQQRLLSIIGFLGKSYRDENGDIRQSKKHKFPLRGLRVLEKYNGMNVDDIEEAYPDVIDRILDFGIEVIEIDMEKNEQFSPLDLFLRLNQRPFPIKPNSFEFWNSYLDRDIIRRTKEIVKDHPGALFRTDDPRMMNEELVMVLGYVAYQTKTGNKSGMDVFHAFARGGKLSVRIGSKSDVTCVLDDAARDDLDGFLRALDAVEGFLVKLESLTGQGFDGLKSLFPSTKSKVANKDIYLLWILLASVDADIVSGHREEVFEVLKGVFTEAQNFERKNVDGAIKEWGCRLAYTAYS
ncbi:DUF262 domain-containing protein [Slackia sp.]|uniref:DUF262 domain-containing protein n=1 Tax=Slackia sp. TaxID=2049041 RepID=UPI0039996BAB